MKPTRKLLHEYFPETVSRKFTVEVDSVANSYLALAGREVFILSETPHRGPDTIGGGGLLGGFPCRVRRFDVTEITDAKFDRGMLGFSKVTLRTRTAEDTIRIALSERNKWEAALRALLDARSSPPDPDPPASENAQGGSSTTEPDRTSLPAASSEGEAPSDMSSGNAPTEPQTNDQPTCRICTKKGHASILKPVQWACRHGHFTDRRSSHCPACQANGATVALESALLRCPRCRGERRLIKRTLSSKGKIILVLVVLAFVGWLYKEIGPKSDFVQSCTGQGIGECACRCLEEGGVRGVVSSDLQTLVRQVKYKATYLDCMRKCN